MFIITKSDKNLRFYLKTFIEIYLTNNTNLTYYYKNIFNFVINFITR